MHVAYTSKAIIIKTRKEWFLTFFFDILHPQVQTSMNGVAVLLLEL
jgi:hypothetical protein